jgi:hypothetical protein
MDEDNLKKVVVAHFEYNPSIYLGKIVDNQRYQKGTCDNQAKN